MSEIMKIIDERETPKKRQKRTRGGGRGDRSYSERVRAKWFCCAFKLGFLWLICKASVEFRVNIINYYKTKRIIWVKACCDGV